MKFHFARETRSTESSLRSRRKAILQLLGVATWARARSVLSAGPIPPPIQSQRFSVPFVDEQGRVISRFDASALYFAEELGAGVRLEMAVIPGGTFEMGSTSNDPAPPFNMSEQPIHRVSVRPFALGVFAITREQWRRVATFPQVASTLHAIPAGGLPPEVEGRLPADVVTFPEAEEFCRRLQRHTGRTYRLPSEAEWEYACRAATTTNYHFGDGISLEVANYNDGIVRPLALSPVGSKQSPNRYRLHDMHGNVLEWCADWANQSYEGSPVDGGAWTESGDPFSRIGRGGMYLWNASALRSAARTHTDVRGSWSGLGFRVATDALVELSDPLIRGGVANAASGLESPVAPGEIIRIRGVNIGPNTPVSLRLDECGVVSTRLSGIRVLFNGTAAPLLYVSADQVHAVVPYDVAAHAAVQVMIDNQGQTSAPVSAAVVESSPALFTADASGRGQAAMLNQDGSANTINNPALRGTVVTVFATGEGQTDPPGIDGKVADPPVAVPVLPVQLFIAEVRAELQYVGSAPGQVAGLLKIEARVPDVIAAGQQPIILKAGGGSSQPDVFMVVG